jgi:dTDP-4-dehydrorhamnose reductase
MSSTKVVVLGGAGMLGHKMFQVLRQLLPGTVCTVREDLSVSPFNNIDLLQGEDVIRALDVTDFAGLASTLAGLRPGFIVNAVGVIKQRAEAYDPVASITINSLLPHRLAEIAAKWGGRVIHFSTDCVFSGKKGGYTEEDPPDAEDLYGRTKFLGEVAGPNALTLRTSIIGRELTEHRSLLDWFLSQEGKVIRGYRRVIYSGVTTNHLAEVVARIIVDHPALSGLYQVASTPISKCDLLRLIRGAYGCEVQIEPDDSVVSDRSMKSDKLHNAIGYVSPPWADMARQLAEDPTPYGDWLRTNQAAPRVS